MATKQPKPKDIDSELMGDDSLVDAADDSTNDAKETKQRTVEIPAGSEKTIFVNKQTMAQRLESMKRSNLISTKFITIINHEPEMPHWFYNYRGDNICIHPGKTVEIEVLDIQ